MRVSRAWVSVCVIVGLFAGPAGAVTIETVPVRNLDNGPDTEVMLDLTTGYGVVGYAYNIGKYEVTAGQYTEFLNKVAKTDTYRLYDTKMWSDGYGCKIQRSGTSGNYTYSVADDWANRPVNFVSWGDAARFANWLHNGQPTGAQNASTTEDGSYALNGAKSNVALVAVTRKANWKWAITSEDEWYKAAYHKNDGTTGNYFNYPTSSNSVPSNILGNPTDPGNNATYCYNYGYTMGSPYWRTEVGDHENSGSPYGIFDQGGNVWEWNEAVIYGSYRGARGGSFNYSGFDMHAASRSGYYPTNQYNYVGFRVSEIPEPATLVLLGLGGLFLRHRRLV